MRTWMCERVLIHILEDILLFKININITLLKMEEDSVLTCRLPFEPTGLGAGREGGAPGSTCAAPANLEGLRTH